MPSLPERLAIIFQLMLLAVTWSEKDWKFAETKEQGAIQNSHCETAVHCSLTMTACWREVCFVVGLVILSMRNSAFVIGLKCEL
jgi:hypothetical protein